MGHRNRVTAYIDGFNLYHAIDDLKRPHFKWIDLQKLCQLFVDKTRQDLSAVYYFSAYATWIPAAYRRHREFVKALKTSGVTVELSRFYEKYRHCSRCNGTFKSHEEKQTDVKIAIWMLDHAYQNTFDSALLISADSDLTPGIKRIRERFSEKKIRVVVPPNRRHSKELGKVVGRNNLKQILVQHLNQCLLPSEITDQNGKVVAVRPTEYDPPCF